MHIHDAIDALLFYIFILFYLRRAVKTQDSSTLGKRKKNLNQLNVVYYT